MHFDDGLLAGPSNRVQAESNAGGASSSESAPLMLQSAALQRSFESTPEETRAPSNETGNISNHVTVPRVASERGSAPVPSPPTASQIAREGEPRSEVQPQNVPRTAAKPQNNSRIAVANEMDSFEDTFRTTAPWFDYDPEMNLTSVISLINASLNSKKEPLLPFGVSKNKHNLDVGPLARFVNCTSVVRKYPTRRATCPNIMGGVICPEKVAPAIRVEDRKAQSVENRSQSLRTAFVLSKVSERFESTKEVLSGTGLFSVVQITPVDWRSHEIQNFTEWKNETWRMKVYSNFLSFLHILEEIQKVYTCKGKDEWVYIFEDDVKVTDHLEPARIPSLIRSAEEDANTKGDPLLYAGVCLRGNRDCRFRKQDEDLKEIEIVFKGLPPELRYKTMQCAGGCAHAWAVKSRSALMLRNLAVDAVRAEPTLVFDGFIGGFARVRKGIITPAAGKCLEHCGSNCHHCGVWSQNRLKFATSINNNQSKRHLAQT